MPACNDCGHPFASKILVNGKVFALCGSCRDEHDRDGDTLESYELAYEREQDARVDRELSER
jgi:hypothetical protein